MGLHTLNKTPLQEKNEQLTEELLQLQKINADTLKANRGKDAKIRDAQDLQKGAEDALEVAKKEAETAQKALKALLESDPTQTTEYQELETVVESQKREIALYKTQIGDLQSEIGPNESVFCQISRSCYPAEVNTCTKMILFANLCTTQKTLAEQDTTLTVSPECVSAGVCIGEHFSEYLVAHPEFITPH